MTEDEEGNACENRRERECGKRGGYHRLWVVFTNDFNDLGGKNVEERLGEGVRDRLPGRENRYHL